MIYYKQGDLMAASEEIIAHGVNCRGVMGSGVAKLIRDKYPKAYNLYMDKDYEDGWQLGDLQTVLQNDGKWIANCATQNGFLPRGMCHADYDAIKAVMEKLKVFAKDKGLKIAIPKIGAGLAGGDWVTIESILNDVFTDYDVTVYHL